ncbi:prepilin-type N-terminal cleavage/methylation domain-containing protein [Maribrevibacterium harenarium]|uniref:Prepilin-type N-terminal cleavage/methylation domain-containing protein n=1 Tax=Maribrevibacterium harenarium TaxID=2589817 RepID=A0A501X255_9GAMM|nr:prepilin-type N-terminal cleavage/methylation domain-containing protein [Maribrevibacterium harenarium]TPE54558.1 prepilin-type N-terminal cleavage/methylation domain-containing protein [Maribrevibacterium harenarium]
MRSKGFTMFEVLVALLVLAVLLTMVVAIQQHWLVSLKRDQVHVRLQNKVALVGEILDGQLGLLGGFGCASDKYGYIEVGQADTPPSRLSSADLKAGSRWLLGDSVGLCAAYGSVTSGVLTAPLSCLNFDVGDPVLLDTCGQQQLATVVHAYGNRVDIALPSSVTSPILAASFQPTYWYLAPSKSHGYALWSKSAISGNGVEVVDEIAQLNFYLLQGAPEGPLVQDVHRSTGRFDIESVKGIWVEYLITLNDCEETTSSNSSYQSFTGETWHYPPSCSQLGQRFIVLGAK